MEETRDHAADPSHASVILHSSKLRKKLDKLAQWRIDPAIIEFSQDAREFRGGFATVLQALLASPYRGVDHAKERSSKAPNFQLDDDTQESGDGDQGKEGGEDALATDGGNDHIQAERRAVDETTDDQVSMPIVGETLAPPDDPKRKGPDLGNLNLESLGEALEPEDGREDEDDEINGHVTSADTGRGRERETGVSERIHEERNHGPQASKPKVVAVKKMKIETETDLERVLGLALREAEYLVELSHSNIMKLEGFVEDLSANKVWLVFPWEEHGNLRDFLATGEWEIPERISLINDVTLGLEYLHGRDPPVYHGDLKSLNILVNCECRSLITDFGSARHLRDDHVSERRKVKDNKPPPATDTAADEPHITLEAVFNTTASTLTLTGSSYTVRWAAPELLQDEKPRLASDIWALGWIAYEVMTNTIPFHDIKKDTIVIKHVIQGHLPSVTEHARMALIRALCSLMVQCWSINPENRPSSEECRKLISWMPMIVPAPTQTTHDEASQLRHAQLLGQLGEMYRNQSDQLNALSCFNQALDIFTSNNDSSGRAWMLHDLAEVHRFRGEHPEAIALHSEALQIYIDAGDESGRASSMFGLAEIHRVEGDYSEAAKLYSECLQIRTNTGENKPRATAIWGLGEVHRLQNEYGEARKLYSEALQIYTDVGERREAALTLWSLAQVHRYQQEYSDAIKLYSEALQIYTDVGDREDTASTLRCLAEVHWFQQEYNTANKLYSQSLQICTEIGDRQGRGTALWGLAEGHRVLHDYDEAIKLHSEAAELFTDIGDKHSRAETLMSLGTTNRMRGHFSEAISLFTEASEVLEELGDSKRASDALRNAADIMMTLEQATTHSAEIPEAGQDTLSNSE